VFDRISSGDGGKGIVSLLLRDSSGTTSSAFFLRHASSSGL
jgi:hypothetical protein